MRVLLLVPMAPQADGLGAMPKLLHAQLRGLARDNEVTVVGSFGELRGQAEAAEGLSEAGFDAHFADRRRSASAARRWRVRAELAADWAFRRRPWRVVSTSGGVQDILDQVVRDRDFDVVSMEDSSLSELRLPAEVPVVLTEHEARRAEPGEPGSRLLDRARARILNVDWRRWEDYQPRAWRAADLVQVYSAEDAIEVSRRAPEVAGRVRINPFGIAVPAAADPELEEANTLLFTGTFTHPPNRDAAHWLATKIMPTIRRAQPQAHLRIVGSSPPSEILGLTRPGIEVIADAPSMAPHLNAAAVVLAPVRSGGGMRLKVLEAMAMGKAVVTTPLGAEGFAELDGEPPLLVAEGVAEIAAITAALLEDRDRRLRLGREAREFAIRLYSPEAWAARLTDVYEEAREIGGRTRR